MSSKNYAGERRINETKVVIETYRGIEITVNGSGYFKYQPTERAKERTKHSLSDAHTEIDQFLNAKAAGKIKPVSKPVLVVKDTVLVTGRLTSIGGRTYEGFNVVIDGEKARSIGGRRRGHDNQRVYPIESKALVQAALDNLKVAEERRKVAAKALADLSVNSKDVPRGESYDPGVVEKAEALQAAVDLIDAQAVENAARAAAKAQAILDDEVAPQQDTNAHGRR